MFHRDGALSLSDIALVGNSSESKVGGLAFFGGSADVLTIDGLTAVDNARRDLAGRSPWGRLPAARHGSPTRSSRTMAPARAAESRSDRVLAARTRRHRHRKHANSRQRRWLSTAGALVGDSFTLQGRCRRRQRNHVLRGRIRANKDFVLERVAVTNNRSTGPSCRGAGVSQNGNGVLTATNVTISNNTGNAPSGLYIELPPGLAGGHHQLTNLTITGNNGGLYTAPSQRTTRPLPPPAT